MASDCCNVNFNQDGHVSQTLNSPYPELVPFKIQIRVQQLSRATQSNLKCTWIHHMY